MMMDNVVVVFSGRGRERGEGILRRWVVSSARREAYSSESAFFSVSEASPPRDARMARVESRACLALASAAIATFSLDLDACSAYERPRCTNFCAGRPSGINRDGRGARGEQ